MRTTISLVTGFVVFLTLQPLAVAHLSGHSFADIVEDIEHGVVNISIGANYARSTYRNQENRNFSIQETPSTGSELLPVGSGVIIEADEGYIVTNNHVLGQAEQVFVTLSDGRSFQAEVVGNDEGMDLALLEIQADNLTDIPIGDSDGLRVGDVVLAVGSPFGLSATVTTGIVSALNRRNLGLDRYEDYIQTDAAINPGSSGGALVNLQGELVGINSAIFTRTGGNVGISFAIPINAAISIVGQLEEFGRVNRGLLGVTFQELTHDLVQQLDQDSMRGVLIKSIVEGSAAMSAGLQEGDLLTHINNVEIAEGNHLRNTMALIRIGEEVKVKFIRDGIEYQGEGTVAPYVSNTISIVGEELDPRFAGTQLKNLHVTTPGVIVADIELSTVAWNHLGLRKNDIIYEVNDQAVKNLDDLYRLISQSPTKVVMTVLREGRVQILTAVP